MEHLFSPCTRYRDRRGRREAFGAKALSIGRWFRGRRDFLQELNLDVSTEELLSAERAFTYADLYAMVENKYMVAWLTPHAAVVRTHGRGLDIWGQMDRTCRFSFIADGKEIYVLARSHEDLLEICDVVLRLLTASVVHSVVLGQWSHRGGVLIKAPTLAYLMEHCQSLKVLTLEFLYLDENHCRVLGAHPRPGLEIELICGKLTSSGASAFWQRSLETIRVRPHLILVVLTIFFSRMGCPETLV
jgi:hypothetical protein